MTALLLQLVLAGTGVVAKSGGPVIRRAGISGTPVVPVPVFHHGMDDAFPCYRVPSLLAVPGVLLAFAECRRFVGDSCEPTNRRRWNNTDTEDRVICARRSIDNGATWGPLDTKISGAAWHAAYPTASYHAPSGTVVLQFSGWNATAGPRPVYLLPTVLQVVSTNLGVTWSTPRLVDGVAPGFLGGCRSDATATGRLLFAGFDHPAAQALHGASTTRVWASDDGGALDLGSMLGQAMSS